MRRVCLTGSICGIVLTLILAVVVGARGVRSDEVVAHEATEMPTGVALQPTEQYPEAGFPSEEEVKAGAVTGRVAIQPRAHVVAEEPAFTAEEVVTFLQSEDHPFEMVASGKGEPSIDTIEFMLAGEAGERIGHGIPAPDDMLVCLVTMHGEFDADENVSGTTSHLVFDGRTGNLLMVTVKP